MVVVVVFGTSSSFCCGNLDTSDGTCLNFIVGRSNMRVVAIAGAGTLRYGGNGAFLDKVEGSSEMCEKHENQCKEEHLENRGVCGSAIYTHGAPSLSYLFCSTIQSLQHNSKRTTAPHGDGRNFILARCNGVAWDSAWRKGAVQDVLVKAFFSSILVRYRHVAEVSKPDIFSFHFLKTRRFQYSPD